jgi:hypothetical protein
MAKNKLANMLANKNMFSQACLSTLAEHVSTLKFFSRIYTNPVLKILYGFSAADNESESTK